METSVGVSMNKNGLFLSLTVPINYFDRIEEGAIIGHGDDNEEIYIKVVEHAGVTVVFTRGKV